MNDGENAYEAEWSKKAWSEGNLLLHGNQYTTTYELYPQHHQHPNHPSLGVIDKMVSNLTLEGIALSVLAAEQHPNPNHHPHLDGEKRKENETVRRSFGINTHGLACYWARSVIPVIIPVIFYEMSKRANATYFLLSISSLLLVLEP